MWVGGSTVTPVLCATLVRCQDEGTAEHRFLNDCSKECWIVSAGYRRRQAEGECNDDLAKRESAPGSRLVFNALSPHWRGPEDDKDGQET